MHRNNYVPTIIEKSARRATRMVCSGTRTMTYFKKAAHRAYRRRMSMHLHDITMGNIDAEEYDDSAPSSCRCTAWDIW
jgi:hypothetical protein